MRVEVRERQEGWRTLHLVGPRRDITSARQPPELSHEILRADLGELADAQVADVAAEHAASHPSLPWLRAQCDPLRL